jgi:hypothetical protein
MSRLPTKPSLPVTNTFIAMRANEGSKLQAFSKPAVSGVIESSVYAQRL